MLRGLIVGGWIVTLLWLERQHALRRSVDSKLRRDIRNFAIAGTAGVVVQFLEIPMAFGIARAVCDRHWGLLQQLPVAGVCQVTAGIVLLDYTLYLWHVLTHRVPFLWRFHKVHHIDREMDASTALRFHFGEITLSLGFRAAQVALIGVSPFTITSWQLFLFLCILFHHSNVRLPLAWERRLGWFVVTPRLHGIHHSIAPEQVNSNWSSGLTVWDWIHKTLRTEVRQEDIVIGVRGHLEHADQTLGNALTLPFRETSDLVPMPERAGRQPLAALR
jgi:sterol desaturase/sphingolipid hydroxylase (fatty acid hydroxylase superfamily)